MRICLCVFVSLCRRSLTVADIRGLADNRSCLSMFTNDKGTIIDDTMITKNADHLYVVVNAGCADKDLLHLNTQLAKWKKNGKDVTMIRQGSQATRSCDTKFPLDARC